MDLSGFEAPDLELLSCYSKDFDAMDEMEAGSCPEEIAELMLVENVSDKVAVVDILD